MTELAQFIINETLTEMSRISGASAGEIVSVIAADPQGATARRFADYVALGIEAAQSIAAAANCP